MIVTAIVLAIIAAIVDYAFGIPEPLRKIIYIGLIILFVIGVLIVLGLLPNFGGLMWRY